MKIVRFVFAGDRRVWIAAAATALVLGGVIGYYVLRPSYPTYTATNSIGPNSESLTVHGGHTTCVPDLSVPAGSAKVRVYAREPRPPLRMTLTTPTGQARAVVPPNEDVMPEFSIPTHLQGPATLCLTPVGKAKAVFGGSFGFHGKGEPGTPTLDGKPQYKSRLSVWMLPRASDRSLVSLADTIIDRASRFRPAWFGPWTYVLLLIFAPLVWLIAIRLLAILAAGGKAKLALTVAAIAFFNAATWAVLNPIFNAPDEPDHVAYEQTLIERGDLPDGQGSVTPPNPAYSSEESATLRSLRTLEWISKSDGRPPWNLADEQALTRTRAEHLARDDGGGELSTSPHSPVYYSSLIPAYELGSGGTLLTRVTLMRLTSALLGGLTAALIALMMLELFPAARFAAAATGLLVAFEPMFTFMSGSVNNDVGVNAAAALLVYLLIRGLRRGLSPRLAIAIGVTMVALPLAKGTGLALLPAAIAALAAMAWRHHRREDLGSFVWLIGAGAVSAAAWLVAAGQLDRTISRSSPVGEGGGGGVIDHLTQDPVGYLTYLVNVFVPHLPFMDKLLAPRWPAFDIYVIGGWANFGWASIQFPRSLYYLIAAVMALAVFLCLLALWRERVAVRARLAETVVLGLVIVGVLAAIEAAYFADFYRPVLGEQGRYVLTALAALAPIGIGACYAFGRRAAVPLATVLVTSTIALLLASYLMTAGRLYS